MDLVEPIKPAQLEALVALYEHYDRPAVPKPKTELLHRVLADIELNGGRVFGIFDSDVCIASASLNICPSLNGAARPYGVIENVIVHLDYRRSGLGRKVLAAAVEQARAVGCYKVMLLTGSQQAGVLAFYSDAGFSATKQGFQIRF